MRYLGRPTTAVHLPRFGVSALRAHFPLYGPGGTADSDCEEDGDTEGHPEEQVAALVGVCDLLPYDADQQQCWDESEWPHQVAALLQPCGDVPLRFPEGTRVSGRIA